MSLIRDKGKWYASHKDVPGYRRSGIFPSMFPSGKVYMLPPSDQSNVHMEDSKENDDNRSSGDKSQPTEESVTSSPDAMDVEICSLPLERAMRIMPHDQNSGAFFVAVLQKNSSLPVSQESFFDAHEDFPSEKGEPCNKSSNEAIEESNDIAEKSTEETLDAFCLLNNEPEVAALELDKPQDQPINGETCPKKTGGKRRLQVQGRWRGVDPVFFFKDEVILDKIKAFYGIDESFMLKGQLVTRNSDTNHAKRIYYISKSVKDTLDLNFLVGQQLKITSIGLKIFERQTSKEGTTSPCTFRISSEGLLVLLPYITKQILSVSVIDLKHLLRYKSVNFNDFVDTEFGKKASNLMLGCCILVLRRDDQTLSDPIVVDTSTIAIGCWKGRGGLNVMVTAVECQELLERHLGQSDVEKEVANKPSNIKTDEKGGINDTQRTEEDEAVE